MASASPASPCPTLCWGSKGVLSLGLLTSEMTVHLLNRVLHFLRGGSAWRWEDSRAAQKEPHTGGPAWERTRLLHPGESE